MLLYISTNFLCIGGLPIFYTGLSQDVNLTQTPAGITCPGETAVFTCSVSTLFGRWVAEPHVSRSQDSVLIVDNPANIGDPIVRGPNDAILITLSSTNPLVTTMTISGSLTENLDVVCEATTDGVDIVQNESLTYQPGSKLISVNCCRIRIRLIYYVRSKTL